MKLFNLEMIWKYCLKHNCGKNKFMIHVLKYKPYLGAENDSKYSR